MLVFGEASATGENQIELNWEGGRLALPVHFSESDIADTVRLLQGSRLITDWESRYPSSEALAPLEKRKQSRVAARLLTLSQTFGLASREMSLVAVVTRPSDRPDELPQTQVVPVGMAQDTAFGAYFLSRSMFQGFGSMGAPGNSHAETRAMDFQDFLSSRSDAAKPAGALRRNWSRLFGADRLIPQFERQQRSEDSARAEETTEDALLDLASRLESDGGMPGKDRESRVAATVIALLAFLSQGHTATQGAFRSHVARLVSFLNSLTGLSSRYQQIIAAVTDLVRRGVSPAGEWITHAPTYRNHWNEVERSVLNVR